MGLRGKVILTGRRSRIKRRKIIFLDGFFVLLFGERCLGAEGNLMVKKTGHTKGGCSILMRIETP